MPPSILLVEYNVDIAQAMILILEDAGYKVTHMTDIRQYLENISSDKYDLLLVDNYMPTNSFKHMMRRLGKRSKIILLGVRPIMNGELIEMKQMGLSAYLTKPFSKANLLDIVKKALSDTG